MGGLVSGAIGAIISIATNPTPVGIAFAVGSFAIQAFQTFSQQGQKAKQTTEPSFAQEAQSRSLTLRSSIDPRRLAIGEIKVGGTLTHAVSTGSSNRYVHTIITLCDGPIQGFKTLYLNDIPIPIGDVWQDGGWVTSTKYSGKVFVQGFVGSQTQAACQFMIDAAPSGEWTEAHQGKGIAYLYVRFDMEDKDVFPSGLPQVSAVVEGLANVEDSRDGSIGYNRNPSAVVWTYLQNPDYGMNALPVNLGKAYFDAAANLCEEDVGLQGGGTEKRYLCNGVIVYGDRRPRDIMGDLLTALGGDLTYSEFEYRLYGAEFRPVAGGLAIDEDAARDTLKHRAKPERRRVANHVRAKFVDPERTFELSSAPEITEPGLEAEDGEKIVQPIELPFTTSIEAAQRISKIHLLRLRQPTIEMPCNHIPTALAVAENVAVTIDKLNIAAQTFQCVEYRDDPGSAITIKLIGDDASLYAWSPGDATVPGVPAPPAEPDLPPGPVTGLSAQQNGSAQVQIQWVELTDGTLVNGYDVAYGPIGGDPNDARPLDDVERGTQILVASIPPGDWVVYVWGLDRYKKRSATAASTTVQVRNFNDIIEEFRYAPDWLGKFTGWVRHPRGYLIPSSTKSVAEMTKEEFWESYVPYPVDEGTIIPNDIDLGFDAASVRIYSESVSRLGPGVTEGRAAPRFDIDTRLDAGFYLGYTLNWTGGYRDFRHMRSRQVNDHTLGRIVLEDFAIVLDVQEAALRQVEDTVPIGGKFVNFPQPFHNPPSVGVNAEPVAGVPRFGIYEADSVTELGFFCTVTTADGSDVGGAIIYDAVGALGRRII